MIHKEKQNLLHKLAYVIGQKKPLSDCAYYVEFSRSADQDSEVFRQMAYSITHRMVEIHGFLKRELRANILKALFWSNQQVHNRRYVHYVD